MSLVEKLFGSFSDRELKKINPIAKQVLALEEKYAAMPDADLQAQTAVFKQQLADGKTTDDILPDAFAVCREAAWRVLGMKHFPVQVIGGIALHRGDISEMQTGEGKTLVATLPAYLNALTGEGVHVVTVNDYLAKRDSEWMGKLYRWLGLSVGLIAQGMDGDARRAAYAADITYGTNNEFGFDYLRDNMVTYKANIQSAEDIQDALKDLLGGTIKEMMEAEMDDHLGYEKSQRSDSGDYRNGYKRKRVNSRYGSMEIEVPQDRKSTFEPQVVKKRQKDISDIDQKIISMYAKGMTTRQISETIEDIYGFETSEGFISDVTDKILPQIEDWQNRPLDEVYPILYIDAIHYSVRDNGVIRKLAAYVILGINAEGKKEVLTISIGENESSKYWLSVLNELKNRGVKDILIICADGLTGIKEAIAAAFPKTEYQRCIVHQVRNTLRYVPDKDRKAFATDLKTIYQAADEKKALAALDRVMEKWTAKYPNSMKRWKDNWDAISPIFKFSAAVRKVIYTTNAIESLNSTYRKLNRQRSVFPSDTALLKALYLATFEATKKWTATIRNWAQVYGELSIMYEGRLPE